MSLTRSTIDIRNVSDGCMVRITMDMEDEGQKFAETKFDHLPSWEEVMHFCELSASEILKPTEPRGSFITIPAGIPAGGMIVHDMPDPILSGPIKWKPAVINGIPGHTCKMGRTIHSWTFKDAAEFGDNIGSAIAPDPIP